jgi:type II secretory pathway pseudopilin PulG
MMPLPGSTFVGSAPAAARRAGFSLLEVLVALGLLVAGLTSVAALMPAAGIRLAEATAADRAGVLAANALAEMRNRRMITADVFPSGSAGKAVVGGEVLEGLPVNSHATLDTARGINALIRVSTGFQLKDDLRYRGGATQPTNTFDSSGGRAYRPGIRFGFTVTPTVFSGTVEPGVGAILSVAVFNKDATVSPLLSLQPQPAPVGSQPRSGTFRLSGTGAGPAQQRKRFLSGCSWVLAVDDAGTPPKWLQIGSSWTTETEEVVNDTRTGRFLPGISYVSFADEAARSFPLSGGVLKVFGFEGLLRIDERIVVLE